MKKSQIVTEILFDWDEKSEQEIVDLCKGLPKKVIRWLGANHPDNRTRKIFYSLTNVTIGENTVINERFIVSDGYKPLLTIGKRVAISPNVTVICESGPNNSELKSNEYVKSKLICDKPVFIGDDVWVGSNVIILPGVTIGERSVIGAGSVVLRDVPSDTIVAGVPARVVKALK
jgi:acetyltransferase-like isoleucine patch superfamily enzyme